MFVSDKDVKLEREKEEDEDDVSTNCHQSSTVHLHQQIIALVDIVSQLSVIVATLTDDKVNKRSDQNIRDIQKQCDRYAHDLLFCSRTALLVS